MRVRLYLVLILLTTLTISKGQYSPAEPDSLNWDSYSKTELRQLFLDMNEHTEVYQLAKKSRRNHTWSVIFYSIGALYAIGGLASLSNAINGNDTYGIATGAALVGLGVGTAGISLGIWQSKKSKRKLRSALDLYQKN